MKGSLHTTIDGRGGWRETASDCRRISHCFVNGVPGHEQALIITDAAVNIAPSLEDIGDIVQNAIRSCACTRGARSAGRVLSAMEMVNPRVPSTIEAPHFARC